MYAVTTEDEELVSLIANTGKQEAAAPSNKDDQRALEIAQVPIVNHQNHFLNTQISNTLPPIEKNANYRSRKF